MRCKSFTEYLAFFKSSQSKASAESMTNSMCQSTWLFVMLYFLTLDVGNPEKFFDVAVDGSLIPIEFTSSGLKFSLFRFLKSPFSLAFTVCFPDLPSLLFKGEMCPEVGLNAEECPETSSRTLLMLYFFLLKDSSCSFFKTTSFYLTRTESNTLQEVKHSNAVILKYGLSESIFFIMNVNSL